MKKYFFIAAALFLYILGFKYTDYLMQLFIAGLACSIVAYIQTKKLVFEHIKSAIVKFAAIFLLISGGVFFVVYFVSTLLIAPMISNLM